ncbi:cysteine hydrolase [Streptacidiphilus sp. PB12-B1b]|nr:cysteine hydrolase [Streptacidiphilus sp. PB12-B1b]
MSSALLVMDVQQGIVDRFPADGLLDRLQRAVSAAREAGIPVVFVRVAFRPGFPEVSPNNRTFSALAESGGDAYGVDSPQTQVHPSVAPQPGEAVVVKKRVSAFTGSDLEVVLRSLGATRLVLAGISTSGVVLSTVREAADRDYRLTVLADGCADQDQEVHRVLLEKVFPRQSDVLTVAEWTATLGPDAQTS